MRYVGMVCMIVAPLMVALSAADSYAQSAEPVNYESSMYPGGLWSDSASLWVSVWSDSKTAETVRIPTNSPGNY